MVLLDIETGEEVPDGEVGHCGLKSPTLALGYWNDSVNTFRTRLNGYYLTGDLLYRDAEGYYYHVDRASDAIDLGGGDWLYTAMSEERILVGLPGRPGLQRDRRPGGRRHACAPRCCWCWPSTPIRPRPGAGRPGRARRAGGSAPWPRSSRFPTTAW